jgi:hypothetical protein
VNSADHDPMSQKVCADKCRSVMVAWVDFVAASRLRVDIGQCRSAGHDQMGCRLILICIFSMSILTVPTNRLRVNREILRHYADWCK